MSTKPVLGRNALAALEDDPPPPRRQQAAADAGEERRPVNVMLADRHIDTIDRVAKTAKRATKTTLDRSKSIRAMLDVLAHLEDRLDFTAITSEEALVAAILGMLRPK